jgi:hypothetical protein
MKRSILAVAAVVALASVSAFAQTAGVRPSFNDAPDAAPIAITGDQTVDQHMPKGSMNSGGPKGPATAVLEGTDRSDARYANASTGTRSDASAQDRRPIKTLNDTFNYPAY